MKDAFECLVQQTVRDVLFCEPSAENQTPTKPNVSTRDDIKRAFGPEIQKDSLLHLLLSQHAADPAEDEDNNAVETRCGSWLVGCPEWSTDRLRREKADIKRFLNAQHEKLPSDSKESDMLMLHEAYALLKLFLLERDPDYRQSLQQSMGCTSSFLTSLHVQLTLYATYFERAHGRQISKKIDVKPIGTLYEFFVQQTQ